MVTLALAALVNWPEVLKVRVPMPTTVWTLPAPSGWSWGEVA